MLTHVVQLEEIGTGDVEQVGGKAANLGELIRGGLPVPGGFVVTAQAFLAALDEAGVRQTVRQRLAAVDVDDPVALSAAAHELQGLVRSAPLPDTLFKELLHAYHDLGDNVSVAVRSSATSEDS
ncbi:MAG: PEP/pyruvate-binding domain-containing protein, partial [Actinomycetes bacterium]